MVRLWFHGMSARLLGEVDRLCGVRQGLTGGLDKSANLVQIMLVQHELA